MVRYAAVVEQWIDAYSVDLGSKGEFLLADERTSWKRSPCWISLCINRLESLDLQIQTCAWLGDSSSKTLVAQGMNTMRTRISRFLNLNLRVVKPRKHRKPWKAISASLQARACHEIQPQVFVCTPDKVEDLRRNCRTFMLVNHGAIRLRRVDVWSVVSSQRLQIMNHYQKKILAVIHGVIMGLLWNACAWCQNLGFETVSCKLLNREQNQWNSTW